MCWRLFMITLISAFSLPFTAYNSCMEACEMFSSTERRFKNSFPDIDSENKLFGQETWGRHDLVSIAWGDPLTFKKIDEPKEVTAYDTITSPSDGKVFSGRFVMSAVMNYESMGAAFNAEYFVTTKNIRLVERIPPLQAPTGWRGIVPGEFVSRPIANKDTIDDKYLIEFPANKPTHLYIRPFPDEYPFVIVITKDGGSLSMTYDKNYGIFSFQTNSAGRYEIRVTEPSKRSERPIKYIFFTWWDDSLSNMGISSYESYRVLWGRDTVVAPSSKSDGSKITPPK